MVAVRGMNMDPLYNDLVKKINTSELPIKVSIDRRLAAVRHALRLRDVQKQVHFTSLGNGEYMIYEINSRDYDRRFRRSK